MSAIQLTASQAEKLAKELISAAPNTARVSQKAAYGPVYIETWSPQGAKTATAA